MASNRKRPTTEEPIPPVEDVVAPSDVELPAPELPPEDDAEPTPAEADPVAADDTVDPPAVRLPRQAPNRKNRRFGNLKRAASRFVPKLKARPTPLPLPQQAAADDRDDDLPPPAGQPSSFVPEEEDGIPKKLLKKMREAAEQEQAEQERRALGMQKLGAVIQHCWGDNVDGRRAGLSSRYLAELARMETAELTGDGGFKMKLENGNSVVHGFLPGQQGPEGEPGEPIEYIKGTRWGFTSDDAHAIIALAALHGWHSVEVHGNESQKKELYLAAMAQGLDVTGYQPDAKTLQQGQIARALWEQENPDLAPMTDDTPAATQSSASPTAPVDGTFDDPVPPAAEENTETVAHSAAPAPEATGAPETPEEAAPEAPAKAPAKTGQSEKFNGAAKRPRKPKNTRGPGHRPKSPRKRGGQQPRR